MRRSGFSGRLARTAAGRPWWTIGLWLVVVAAAALSLNGLGEVLTEEGRLTVTTEAQRAEDLYIEHFALEVAEQEFVLVEADGITTDQAAFQAKVGALVEELRSIETVATVVSYLDGAPGVTSADGSVALIPVTMVAEGDAADLAAPVVEVIAEADADPGYRVTTLGTGSILTEFNGLAEDTLRRGEVIGVPIALVILVVVFGAVVAAGLPLALAVVAIVVALGMTVIIGQAFDLSVFVVNMITMIGLAVGIDYSLFVVQRFREERAKGYEVIDAIERAGDSATRAVFFSGMTVVVALTGLLYMPDTIMRSLGIGAILVVLAAVAGALTVLPAALGLLGDRVNNLKIPFLSGTAYHAGGGRFWHRITRAVTARPVLSIALAGGLLLAAALPFLTLRTGQNFIESLPEDSDGVHAFRVLNAEFDTGAITTQIVVEADAADPPTVEAVDRLVVRLDADPVYGDVTITPSPDGAITVVDAVTKVDPSTLEARDAVAALRTQIIPETFGDNADVFVGGDAAWTADYVGVINSRTPIIFAFVLGLSFIVLMLVFRSIVVPLKAIIMNLLSVGAAYGLLVLVFQHGVGADILGFQQTDVIEAWIPLFLFAVLFGLSMDYHIFLLSRIKERYDLTGDNDESVVFGLGSTGAIITGAALIMVAVFGGFAAGDLVMFQQMGFGLGIAVILDATIVRSVLVPATMKLLGDRNWYLPNWLHWLPEIHIEGRPEPLHPGTSMEEPASH